MRSVTTFGLVALSMMLSTALYAGDDAHATGVKWVGSLEDAKKQAADSKKHIFIEFTAEW